MIIKMTSPSSPCRAETRISEQASAIQSLQDKLQESEAREVAEALKRERLMCDRDAAINRVRVLESEIGDARRRIGERDEKYVLISFLWSS